MKYFSICLLLLCSCGILNPDKDDPLDVSFSVDGNSITIYRLFKNSSSYKYDVPWGARSLELTAKKGDESHHLSFSNITWAMVDSLNHSVISLFEVDIDGHGFSYAKLHMDGELYYVNAQNDYSGEVYYLNDHIELKARGAQGNIDWSFEINASGGSIDQNGLYRAGPKGMTKDIIVAKDASNNTVKASIYVSGSFDIIADLKANKAGPLVFDQSNMWLLNSRKLYKLDKNIGIIESETINLEIPNVYIMDITYDGTNFWFLEFYRSDSINLYNVNTSGKLNKRYDISKINFEPTTESCFIGGLSWDGNNLWTTWQGKSHAFIKISTNGDILGYHKYIPSAHFDVNMWNWQYYIGIETMTWDGSRLCGMGEYGRLGCFQNGQENEYFHFAGQGIEWDGECFWISRATGTGVSVLVIKPKTFN